MKLNRAFLTMTGLLALLHIYVGARLIPDLGLGPTASTLAIGALAASFLLMPLSMMARSARRATADRIAWAGFFSMGAFSSFFVFTLLRDAFLWIALALAPEHANTLRHDSALATIGIAAFATLVGLWNARRRARVVEREIPIDGLPESLHGFTIVQISDVHVGATIKRDYVAAIVEAVNMLEADAIALTGDIVDGSVRDLALHVEPLSRLRARHGAFFVTGNHEYYSGEAQWTREFRRLGLTVLLNEHVALRHGDATVILAGITDFSAHHFNPSHRSDPQIALAGAPSAAGARILLAHQPRSAAAAEAAGFDLQLSGHTHGGQFWPWNHFVRFQQPYTAGLHRLNKLWIYISRGTGYWGPPKRFGAPSEIARLRLVRGRAL